MISFESDYNNGAHPKVLEALIKTNDEQTLSYGFDRFSIDAKEKIKTLRCSRRADMVSCRRNTDQRHRHRLHPTHLRGCGMRLNRTYSDP